MEINKEVLLFKKTETFYTISIFMSYNNTLKIEILMNGIEASSGDSIQYIEIDDYLSYKIQLPFCENNAKPYLLNYINKND